MSDLIFAGSRNSIFCRERSLRPLLRPPVGGPHGNNHCRDHRAAALHLLVCGDDPPGKILRNRLCKLQVGFNSLSTSSRLR